MKYGDIGKLRTSGFITDAQPQPLFGQISPLSSQPPNALGIWFGFEVRQAASLVRLRDERQVLAYSLLGLVCVGFGHVLLRGVFASFATARAIRVASSRCQPSSLPPSAPASNKVSWTAKLTPRR